LPAKGDLAKLAEALKEMQLKKLPGGKTVATKGVPLRDMFDCGEFFC
jgi:hypothetical protein